MGPLTKLTFRLNPKDDERVKAWVTVLYGDFVIEGFRVVDGANGMFVAMPSRELKPRDADAPSTWQSTVHMLDPLRRKAFEAYVIKGYELEVKEQRKKQAKEPAKPTV